MLGEVKKIFVRNIQHKRRSLISDIESELQDNNIKWELISRSCDRHIYLIDDFVIIITDGYSPKDIYSWDFRTLLQAKNDIESCVIYFMSESNGVLSLEMSKEEIKKLF